MLSSKKYHLWLLFLGLVFLGATATTAKEVPAERLAKSDEAIVAKIDGFLQQGWKDNELTPSPEAEEGEFARRATLDIIGRIPSYDELLDFLEDDSSDKKQKYVNYLLSHPDYIRHWTNIWGNMLVGRGNIRRGNRAAFDKWLRNAFYKNMRYDKFVFELISAEGKNNENGAVSFLASHLNNGAVPATAITSRVFLGLQVQCTQCHNHPFNNAKQSQFWGMNAFFRGTRRQRNEDQNSFTLVDNPVTIISFYEKRSGFLEATKRQFVDGTTVKMDETSKPRLQLAKLVTDPKQPFIARTEVNRMWGHLFGYGFTRPVDDMGAHNPPSHPKLLDFLSDEFRKSGYNRKRLIRWITATKAYRLTSQSTEGNNTDNPAAGNTPLFSKVYVKSFSAEQLYNSLLIATEVDKVNRNAASAEQQRSNWLKQFVQTFGTDENDESTTFNGTIPQALVMMNGSLTQNAINGQKGGFLYRLLSTPDGKLKRTSTLSRNPSEQQTFVKKKVRKKNKKKKKKRSRNKRTARNLDKKNNPQQIRNGRRAIPKKIETLFMITLARKPTEHEMVSFNDIFSSSGEKDPILGMQDVFWALLNCNEFIVNH
ncbi:hypothetical protein MNBD_PLANCTO02-2671 [hydrothermal vent metagenome]|uniref:DUF1549 domain-containing protein n=1 Tax=hydrothermal vent metagenome TaxID=652676 RepID=A0A3B1DDB2_9ZZZZ